MARIAATGKPHTAPIGPSLRFRIDFCGRCSVGVGKIELLEAIAREGSLSQAARSMRMSYRRAWLLLEDLNTSFDLPVATTTTGGRGGGGAVLSEFGGRLVAAYRDLEAQLRPLANARLQEIGGHAGSKRTDSLQPTPLSRSLPAARPAPTAMPGRRLKARRRGP